MKTIDSIPDEFFKQFKTGEELNSFFRELQKRAVEKMLEGKLDAHLDYDKHDSKQGDNTRNGYSNKKIKTRSGGEQTGQTHHLWYVSANSEIFSNGAFQDTTPSHHGIEGLG